MSELTPREVERRLLAGREVPPPPVDLLARLRHEIPATVAVAPDLDPAADPATARVRRAPWRRWQAAAGLAAMLAGGALTLRLWRGVPSPVEGPAEGRLGSATEPAPAAGRAGAPPKGPAPLPVLRAVPVPDKAPDAGEAPVPVEERRAPATSAPKPAAATAPGVIPGARSGTGSAAARQPSRAFVREEPGPAGTAAEAGPARARPAGATTSGLDALQRGRLEDAPTTQAAPPAAAPSPPAALVQPERIAEPLAARAPAARPESDGAGKRSAGAGHVTQDRREAADAAPAPDTMTAPLRKQEVQVAGEEAAKDRRADGRRREGEALDLARRALESGRLPPAGAIRAEELVQDLAGPSGSARDTDAGPRIRVAGAPTPARRSALARRFLLWLEILDPERTAGRAADRLPGAGESEARVDFNPKLVARYRRLGSDVWSVPDVPALAAMPAGRAAGFAAGGRGLLFEVEIRPTARRGGDLLAEAVLLPLATGGTSEREQAKTAAPLRARVHLANLAARFDQASAATRRALLAAQLGEVLQGSAEGGAVDLAELARLARSLAAANPGDAQAADLAALGERAAAIQRARR